MFLQKKHLGYAAFVLALAVFVLVGCDKETAEDGRGESPVCLSSLSNTNPYNLDNSRYANDVVSALFDIIDSETVLSFDEWMAKVDSVLTVHACPSPVFDESSASHLDCQIIAQLFNTFFENLTVMDVDSAADLAETDVRAMQDENAQDIYLYAISHMRCFLNALDESPMCNAPLRYAYLDCMREKMENMNPIEWVNYVLNLPKSFFWDVAACYYDAYVGTQQQH